MSEGQSSGDLTPVAAAGVPDAANESVIPAPSAAPGSGEPSGSAPGGGASEAAEDENQIPEGLIGLADLAEATVEEIVLRFAYDSRQISEEAVKRGYCPIVMLDPYTDLGPTDLDRIFRALKKRNADHRLNVLLFLLSSGGKIEPAYQIAKICKSYAKKQFVVCVPRYAKSAATLVALGADEIHMGPLGQLGPIDPQIGGLPALAVAQAIDTIANVTEKHPASSTMLAKYLESKLSVEQIGYCDRIVESAAQYAERLLSKKAKFLPKPARDIARELVYEYKDHGFVIDLDEAQQHLGRDWVKADTPLTSMAEGLYAMFSFYQQMLQTEDRRIYVTGSLHPEDLSDSISVWRRPPQ